MEDLEARQSIKGVFKGCVGKKEEEGGRKKKGVHNSGRGE